MNELCVMQKKQYIKKGYKKDLAYVYKKRI